MYLLYRTRAIISRSLHIFNPIFHCGNITESTMAKCNNLNQFCKFSYFRRSSIIKLPEKTVEEEKLNQLSLDAEKIMDELLVAPSPSRAKGGFQLLDLIIMELKSHMTS